MKWFRRVLIVLGLLPILIQPVHAQSFTIPDYHERIDNYQVKMDVASNNVATVSETITYNFGAYQRHGIERYIPIKTRDSSGKGKYYYQVNLISVTADGNETGLLVKKRAGNYFYIRIGDANKLITGAHTYVVKYTVQPVMSQDGADSYFNWNIIGTEWKVPINQAAGVVTFPNASRIKDSRCYSGEAGSTESNCDTKVDANTVSVNINKPLDSYEGLTLNALVSGHGFTNYLTLNNRPKADYLPLFGYVVGIGALLLGVGRQILKSIQQSRKKADQTVIPEYDAPDGLSPGEVGHLVDNRSTMVEITATLIDIARRGYIKIEQTREKTTFKKAEYKFHWLKRDTKLRKYEKDLLDAIFDGKSEIELAKVSKTKVPPAIERTKAVFKKNLEAKNYYILAEPTKAGRSKLLFRVALILLLLTTAFNIVALINGVNGTYVGFSFGVAFFGPILGMVIAQKVRYSEAGFKQWAKVEGLKLYLSVAEKDRIKFHNAPKKTPNLFNKLLPYAIALGVEREWAKQFEGIDLEAATTWYSSPHHHFTAYYLASSLSSDFSSSVVSNFSPPSQSSSSGGFSGGGFSGGGGGGGGGGSW